MKAYKGILFDLDHTLFDHDTAQNEALNVFHARYVKSHGHELAAFKKLFYEINKPLWDQVATDELSMTALKTKRFEILSEKLNIPWNMEEAAEYYLKFAGKHGEWLPGAEDAVDDLIAKGYQIGILTNGYKLAQEDKRDRLGLHPDAGRCKCFIVSEEHGFLKPHKKIFDIALELMNLPKEEILMVGDSLLSDGQGAENAGIDFCWINPLRKRRTNSAPLIHLNLASVAALPQHLPDIVAESF